MTAYNAYQVRLGYLSKLVLCDIPSTYTRRPKCNSCGAKVQTIRVYQLQGRHEARCDSCYNPAIWHLDRGVEAPEMCTLHLPPKPEDKHRIGWVLCSEGCVDVVQAQLLLTGEYLGLRIV